MQQQQLKKMFTTHLELICLQVTVEQCYEDIERERITKNKTYSNHF